MDIESQAEDKAIVVFTEPGAISWAAEAARACLRPPEPRSDPGIFFKDEQWNEIYFSSSEFDTPVLCWRSLT